MTDQNTRRRDLLRGTAVGALALGGWTTLSAGSGGQETTTEQETTTPAGGDGADFFSYSLQEGDQFRVRLAPRDPAGNPATETVPAGCLDGEGPEEFQLYLVRAYRDGSLIGFRGLLARPAAVETETPETETETTPAGETTTAVGGVTSVRLGQWYTVTGSETCDGLNRVTLQTAQAPETTVLETGTAEVETEVDETTTET